MSCIFITYFTTPDCLSDDGDPLDIMVLSYEPLEVGCIVKARVIGALIIEDEEVMILKFYQF